MLHRHVTHLSLVILASLIGFNVSSGVSEKPAAVVSDKPNPRIAYVDDLDIYLMNADGSKQTQLTAIRPGPSEHPTWSPDGRKIAFDALISDPPDSPNSEIFVVDVSSREQTRLTHLSSNEVFPVWSPGGNRIAFVSDRDGNWEIYVMNTDGSNQIRLTDNEAMDGLHGLTWSPDGSRLAYVSDQGEGRDENTGYYEAEQIYVIDVDKAAQNNATDNLNLTKHINICPTGEFYLNPSWSINNELATALSCGYSWDIYLLSIDDALQTQNDLIPLNLTHTPLPTNLGTPPVVGTLGLDWSPDGAKIVFVTNPDVSNLRKYEIFVMDVAATLKKGSLEVMQLTNKPNVNAFYAFPVWEKDSNFQR